MPHVPDGWEDVHALARDAESGAAEIARRAAVALSALPRSDLGEAVRALLRGHPSMAPLWRLGDVALSADDHTAAAWRFARDLRVETDAVSAAAGAVLPSEVVTLSFSSTLVAAVAAAGAVTRCARSDPGGEGVVTVERLRARGVDARLVEDAEAIAAAARGTAVVVGADAVGPGGVVNKVGTRALAEASRRGGAPAYVVAGSSKLLAADLPAPTPFERTPLDLITAVIGEDGPVNPAGAARLAASHRVAAALMDLL
jgi:translation initiation factor 2B subunit (eIF-2B alpha/beta/delta family)